MSRLASLAAFLLMVVGGGLLVGFSFRPGPWYEALDKPWFNPPDWLFGPVWTILYVFIAIAGWRCWHQDGRPRMALWWTQLALNFLWPAVFFGWQAIGAALALIVVLLAAIVAFIAAAWPGDRVSALLFVPYGLWVAFATALNAAIWWLN